MSGKSKSKKKPIKLETTLKASNSKDTKNEANKTNNKHTTASKPPKNPETKVENPLKESIIQFPRETDDVLIISEPAPSSKYSKREITNNWSKYEVTLDSYEKYEDKDALGADFEELLHMPVSSGYFQFKHEKLYVAKNKSSETDDLFALDMKSISDGVLCVPFYERNRLDPLLFDKDHIDRMNKAAQSNRKQFDKNDPVISQEKEIAMKMLHLLNDDKPKAVEIVKEKTSEKEEPSKITTTKGSGIEDIILDLDVDQWLEEHLEKEDV